jgi:hypothetical protein
MTPRPDRIPFARADYAAASAFSAKSFWRAVTILAPGDYAR